MAVCVLHQTGHIRLSQDDGIQIIQRYNGHLIHPDSFLRLGRMRTMVRMLDHKVRVADIKKMMSDHTSYPDSICRHEDELEPAGKRLGTIFSIIMDLEREEMYFAPGNPCKAEYHLIKF